MSTQPKSLPKKNGPSSFMSFSKASSASVNSLITRTISDQADDRAHACQARLAFHALPASLLPEPEGTGRKPE
jgi:hypothetical protein